MSNEWSNLAKIVFARTYSRRQENGSTETWPDTIERVIAGNCSLVSVPESEQSRLRDFMLRRKAIPAGRGLWFSGSPAHSRIGGKALNNCWLLLANDWENFVLAQDLLMLGGGVGLSVEHKYSSKLPRIKRDVSVLHQPDKSADFIVPDSREGWCELTRRTLESYFVTGRSFSYSTVCIRGAGEYIHGFGGVASGPLPLVRFISNLCRLLSNRSNKHLHPIDAADIITAIGEMVVAGNVRRSAIIVIGDCFDKEYLLAKRWDLQSVPSYRSRANYSVVCDDVDDLHPSFWKTYEHGEPFGIINRRNIQAYGRMGERRSDSAVGVNPCFRGDTKILTRQGYFEVKELLYKPVEVWDGTWWCPTKFKITGINQPILKITLQDGSEEFTTPYHSYILENNAKKLANTLVIGDKLKISNAPNIPGSIKSNGAYLKGFLIGDGSLVNNTRAGLSLYSTKYSCIIRLTKSASEISPAKIVTNSIINISFTKESKQKRRIMQGLGIRNYELKKWASEYKQYLPLDIYNWCNIDKYNFIAGILDADGSAMNTKNGFGYQISSIYKQWLLDFQRLLKTIGVKSKVVQTKAGSYKKIKNKSYYCQDLYRLTISQEASIILSTKVNFSRLVSFKTKTTSYKLKSKFNKIVAIEEVGITEKVYCCNVHTNHSLALQSGIQIGQCAEATLECYEPCNLQEIALMNLANEAEFAEAAVLMHRYGKRVTLEDYKDERINNVIERNRRIGTGITGCLGSSLFNSKTLDNIYKIIAKENYNYSKELNIAPSIRTTLIKPSGTVSKVLDQQSYEGLHPAFSRYMIQRIRFAANDNLIPLLRNAGHHMEPEQQLDGSINHDTQVVDFYLQAPAGLPVADEDWNTWKQLDVLLMAQKYWADQACSVTVYYKREEIPQLKEWLHENLQYLKTISFLCHSGHGFKQAPKEGITAEEYEKFTAKVKPIEFEQIGSGNELESLECEGGACPIK